MYELAVQRSEAPIIFSCRFRHGSNPSVKIQYIVSSYFALKTRLKIDFLRRVSQSLVFYIFAPDKLF